MLFRIHFTIDNGDKEVADIEAKTPEDARKRLLARYRETGVTVQLKKTKVVR